MKNVIMESPHQVPFCWTAITIENLRNGAYYEGIFDGWRMHTHDLRNVYHDIETWIYPNKQIENKIEDNKQYKVWAVYHDASDPMDLSCSYTIIYIEEV